MLKVCNELEDSPLWIDESSDLGILDLRAKARRLHAQEHTAGNGGLALIIIDYIQLMRAEDTRANRVEQVGQMSRGLKILARELKVPVIALSQLSRAPEQRTGRDKRPILSDLRESGNLEQDADLVAFIYREDYYKNFGDDDVDEAERAKPGGGRRADRPQEPQRADRHGRARVPGQVRVVPEHLARRQRPRGGSPGPSRRRWSTRPTPMPGARVQELPRSCPLGKCDGSGWIVDDDDSRAPAPAASAASPRRAPGASARCCRRSTRA